jgi:hypothetical protein
MLLQMLYYKWLHMLHTENRICHVRNSYISVGGYYPNVLQMFLATPWFPK